MVQWIALLVASMGLVTTAVVSEPMAPNLVPNPGFEEADGDAPAFWEKRTPDDGSRQLAWSDVARSGKRSLAIANAAATISRWRTGHLQDTLLRSGSRCELSGWIRTDGVEGSARLRLYFIDGADHIVQQPASPVVEGTREWTRVRLPFAVPDVPTYAMVYVEIDGTGKAWFDDLLLTGEAVPGPAPGKARVTRLGPDAFARLQGLGGTRVDGRECLGLAAGKPAGEGLLYFPGETARYDILVEYLPGPGDAALALRLNDRELGSRSVGAAADAARKEASWTLKGVDVQRNSRLGLAIRGAGAGGPAVLSLAFRLAGRFQGALLPPDQVAPPPSLQAFRTESERSTGRGMVAAWIQAQGAGPVAARREAELAALKTPEEWRAYQQGVRARLAEFWGPFPEKTPLNARVVGAIERERFTIEKVIYESRPGYHVTANFYRPKGRALPVPGVLFVCGHAGDGKGAVLYHECCLGLVLKGYAVLAIDPTGQGERSEYFDPETRKPAVALTVSQHHQLGRPSFLVGQSLGGYRTWDAIRGVDYLLSRAEVDPQKLAAVGNSGGGQMAFLVTAADERIAVCVAAHPGGSMENTYLNGQGLRDREVLSLIAPRPCRVVVGRDSGEGHGHKVEEIRRFCRGLGYDESRCELAWVDGVHDMKQPKRVATYEWVNRWLGKEAEGAEEPPLEPLSAQELWCTETGSTLWSLKSLSGQDLNARRMAEIAPKRSAPDTDGEAGAQRDALRAAVRRRLGWPDAGGGPAPAVRKVAALDGEGFTAEVLTLETEPGVTVPAVLLLPKEAWPDRPVVLHASEWGKPVWLATPSLPVELCRRGFAVLTVDVRGVGETDPRQRRRKPTAAGYDEDQWVRDSQAINAFGFVGRSMEGARAWDLVRCAGALRSLESTRGRRIICLGEGLGGLWALLAAALDPEIAGAASLRALLSYRMLVESPYHEVRGYFWTPGVLQSFDIPELAALIAPRRSAWLGPTDAMAQPVDEAVFRAHMAWPGEVCRRLGAIPEWRPAPAEIPGECAEVLAPLLAALALRTPSR